MIKRKSNLSDVDGVQQVSSSEKSAATTAPAVTRNRVKRCLHHYLPKLFPNARSPKTFPHGGKVYRKKNLNKDFIFI